MTFKRWYLLFGMVVLGFLLLGSGLFLTVSGIRTKTELQNQLAAEKIVTADPYILLTYPNARAPKGVEVPKILIDTADEAHAMAQVIKVHVMAATEGKTWTELPRQIPDPKDPTKMIDNPLRTTYIQGLTLQNALHQAHMGLEITNLVIGVGVLFSVLGVGVIGLGVPALLWTVKRNS